MAGIGLGRLLWGEHASTPQSGVEAPRLLKRSLPRLYYCCVLCVVRCMLLCVVCCCVLLCVVVWVACGLLVGCLWGKRVYPWVDPQPRDFPVSLLECGAAAPPRSVGLCGVFSAVNCQTQFLMGRDDRCLCERLARTHKNKTKQA